MRQFLSKFFKLMTRAIEGACQMFAVVSGLVLFALAMMTVVSILGRQFFGMPVPGDYDVTKHAMGFVIAAFLPYAILNGGTLIVDFFTSKVSQAGQNRLDALGALFLAVGLFLLAWRTSVAVPDSMESAEVMGNINAPVWYVYAAMTPALWLAFFAAMLLAVRCVQGGYQVSEAETFLESIENVRAEHSAVAVNEKAS